MSLINSSFAPINVSPSMATGVLNRRMVDADRTELNQITEADLRQLLKRHKAFLDRMPGGQRASLKFRDFCGMDLSGRCLAEADLSGAKLRYANLRGADLGGANLFGADLTGSDMSAARLEGADLRGATLRDAKLTKANLTRVDLREGMLMAATDGNLEHSHADRGTAMMDATARGASLRDARLSNAVLKQVDLRDATSVTACWCGPTWPRRT
jgi:uncharacterized protein YjbI with pentapeptide repeats